MRFPYYFRYLHEKPLPRLPLWNPGNPRPKIFLPLYWLKMVEPRKPQPSDYVKFECHWQMSASDVRQYLEKLYNVSVLDVRIEIEKGKYMKHPKKAGLLSPPLPDQKYAYVQLKDEKFEWPKLFETDRINRYEKDIKAMENIQNKIKNKTLSRLDIGSWFS